MAAQPPKPPAFCICIFRDGQLVAITPDLVVMLARDGHTESSLETCDLVGDELGFDVGELIAASFAAEGIRAPSLEGAVAAAAALIDAYQQKIERGMR